MVELLVMGLRYALLILLYLFIFRIVVFIIRDLRKASSPTSTALKPSGVARNRELKSGNRETYKPSAELVVLESVASSLSKGEVINIDRNITIGRESANDVRVEDSFASHEHARLFYHKGQYWLEDLGSTNGTFVNGQRIKDATVLLSGDRLKIGGVTFQFARWEHETQ
ncbi:MAG: FHA domain-containing protein [Thermincolia bacterium]